METFARIRLDGDRRPFVRREGDKLLALRGAPWEDAAETGEVFDAASAAFVAPVAPTKIVCVGRNYRAHAAELGNEVPAEPLLFLKPPSAVIGPEEAVVLPRQSQRVEHEAELGVVIGARCRGVSKEEALSKVFGLTCVNDVTARDLQKKDGQWTRAKGFDTFCPAGPVLVAGLDPSALAVRCRVGGELRQEGNTRDMVFSVALLVAYISEIMTLLPGDLIATGTPHGVGPMPAGSTVDVEIEGIGVLRSPVRAGEGSG
jgi:2-keto-4-pentenoate hydratase/2-oxohepta-3-ene-1,7-dioic acid hydratase in catechol pathway